MTEFFDYVCDRCGAPYCERISVMNLALDRVEEGYCLGCLSQAENRSPEVFYHWILDYVEARECFKTPWEHFDPTPCPRIADKTCFCTRP